MKFLILGRSSTFLDMNFESLEGVSEITEPFNNSSKYPIHPAKRLFDIICTIVILIFLAPVIFFLLLSIVVEHTLRLRPLDPLFYSEIRLSQGKPFVFYKFNIFKHDVVLDMRLRGESIDTKKLERDGSMIFVGKILKQIYFDEIPQFFNILKGDMSIVGPRPLNQKIHEKLLRQGTFEKTRVKAGLTGYYQLHHKYGKNITQEESDKIYVEYYFQNPWYKILLFDAKILLQTLKVLAQARGI